MDTTEYILIFNHITANPAYLLIVSIERVFENIWVELVPFYYRADYREMAGNEGREGESWKTSSWISTEGGVVVYGCRLKP